MRKVSILMVVSTLLLPACGSKLPSIKPFKMDVQQGNVVNSKMLLQLRPGMTKSQVRYIMGTPLVVDSFHDNRWYYYYTMRKDGQVADKRSVILDFDKESLLRVRGDVEQETETTATAQPVTATEPVSAAKAPAPSEKTWLQKLKFWGKTESNQTTTPASSTSTEVAATASAESTSAASNPELKVTPELVVESAPVESAPKEAASPEVKASSETVAENKAIDSATESNTTESKITEPTRTSWWERFKFWGNNKSEPTNMVTKPVEATPIIEEVKSIPQTVAEATTTATTQSPDIVVESKTENVVAESENIKPTEKSWWKRFKFWGNDKPEPSLAEGKIAEETPSIPELKATQEAVTQSQNDSQGEVTTSPIASEAKLVESTVTSSVSEMPVETAIVDAKQEIADTVTSWAEAWRSKDIQAYFEKYASDFKPDGLPNKKAWEAQRKQRLSAKQGAISLDISDVKVQQNANQATVKFNQKYATKVYSDQVSKQLFMRLDPTTKKWLIVRETAVPLK